MLKPQNRDMDMTKGNILSLIIQFAFPLIITNLLQSSYNVADSIMVSYSNQPDAVGAIGTTPSFVNLVLNIFIGCSIGAKVLVANKIGAGDTLGVKKSAAAGLVLSILLGAIGAVIACLAAEPVLRLMGNRGSLLELSVIYICIFFSGMPFLALTNFSIALMHARGDTKTPLYVLATTGLMNVILNAVFVFFFEMSVEGVALASLIANITSAGWLVFRVVRVYEIKVKDFNLNREDAVAILRIGMPAGIQGAIFSVSQMMIQSSVVTVNNLHVGTNASYQPIVKGCAACTYVESFASSVIISIGQAGAPFVSQNYGAKNYVRIREVRRVMYGVSFVTAMVVAWSLMALAEPIFSLFGIYKNGDDLSGLAYASAMIRMKYMFIPYFLLGFMEVGAGIVQGLKRSATAAIISLAGSSLLRVVWILTVFQAKPTLENVFIVFPLSWFVTAAAHYIATNIILKKIQTE